MAHSNSVQGRVLAFKAQRAITTTALSTAVQLTKRSHALGFLTSLGSLCLPGPSLVSSKSAFQVLPSKYFSSQGTVPQLSSNE